jgi:hypothetical protein
MIYAELPIWAMTALALAYICNCLYFIPTQIKFVLDGRVWFVVTFTRLGAARFAFTLQSNFT